MQFKCLFKLDLVYGFDNHFINKCFYLKLHLHVNM